MTTDRLPILQRIFHRQCRSLVQYVGESWPWAGRGERAADELFRSILADERRWADRLAELIEERGGVPLAGTYPHDFTAHNLHYLALDFALGLVADAIQRELAQLESELSAVGDEPPIRSLLEQMIERKRGQVEALERLFAAAQSADTALPR